ncbi:MAG: hypothetical protein ACKOTB_07685 [Planctomycetia bacterium]
MPAWSPVSPPKNRMFAPPGEGVAWMVLEAMVPSRIVPPRKSP